MKNYFKFGITLILLVFALQISSCKFFEAPQGKTELLSVYTSEEEYKYDTTKYYVRYLNGTLKITNTGSIDIYNSTVNFSCETSERQYYKTVSFDITISPGSSIFIPIQFDFDTRLNGKTNEKWKTETLKIVSSSWK